MYVLQAYGFDEFSLTLYSDLEWIIDYRKGFCCYKGNLVGAYRKAKQMSAMFAD